MPAAFVRPPRPLRPLASRPPPGPCPWRAGLPGPAARAPALVLFGLGEEGQLFPGRAPPPRFSAHAPTCAAEPYWLRARACSEACGPTSAAPSLQPTVNCLQAGSKDAGGGDWLRRARPPGFSAPAAAVAAITEFPVVSVRSRGPAGRRRVLADRSAERSLRGTSAVTLSGPAPISVSHSASSALPPPRLCRAAARAFVFAAPPGDAQPLGAVASLLSPPPPLP